MISLAKAARCFIRNDDFRTLKGAKVSWKRRRLAGAFLSRRHAGETPALPGKMRDSLPLI
jgi:hypothetical protein